MGLDALTRQERAVADAARSGGSAASIAATLFLSTRTVETHLGSIYRKLGVHTRAELLAYLFERDANQHEQQRGGGDTTLPHALVAAPIFLGRERERAVLQDALETAKGGGDSATLIGGEPGIGKSALAAWAADRAGALGFRVLAGRCDSDFRAPFAPIVDALGPYLADDPAGIAARLGRASGFLGALFPGLAGSLPDRPLVIDPGTARRMLVSALIDLLAAAARSRPTMLVVEDLHWADQATLGFFRALIESRSAAGLALVATFRDTELVREHPLSGFLANLWREASVRRVELEGLTAAETAELALALSGSPMDDDGLRAFEVRTGGNPYFITQLLMDSGPARVGSAHPLPPSVREVVVDRAARLGDGCLATLQTAAVFGQEFEPRLLVHAMGAADADEPLQRLARSLGDAEAAGLIAAADTSDGRLRFSHDLVREAVLGQLSAVERALAHRRAGNAMLAVAADKDPAQLVALATHFGAAAALGDGALAARFSLLAAQNAADAFAPEDALALASRGLGYLGPDEDDQLRLELLTVIIDAQATRMDLSAHRAAILDAVAIARRIGTPLALAQTVDRNTVLPIMGVLDEELLAIKQEAIAALGDEPTALRTRLLVSAAYQRTIGGHGWAAADQAEAALADSRLIGDRKSRIAALYALAAASAGRPDLRDQLTVADELIALSTDPLGRVPEQDGRRFRALLRLASGDRAGFESDLRGLAEFADQSESVFVRSLVAEWRAMIALLDGDVEHAEDLANTALGAAGDDPNFQLGWLVQLIEVRLAQNRVDEARGMADMAFAQNPNLAAIRALTAATRLRAGDEAGAYELAAPLLASGPRAVPEDWLRPATLGYLAPVAAALGTAEERQAVGACLEPYAGQMLIAGAGALVVGVADHLRAALVLRDGRPAAAAGLYEAAAELAARCGAMPFASESRAELRRTLEARA